MRAALFAFSRGGCATARRVMAALPEAAFVCYTMERFEEPAFLPLNKAVYGACFSAMDTLIFVGACGIAVREIAPYVQSKKTDPAVLCIDEAGRFVIPLLSGHIGGANALAEKLAEKLDATAVVTTATDVRGKFAVDAWAARHGCAISDMGLAKAVSAAILEGDVPLCSQFPLPSPLPEGTFAGETGSLGIFIGWRARTPFARTLRLIPRVLRVGVGCRRGISVGAVENAVQAVFAENGLDTAAICGVYSIDLKQDEAGLLAACERNGWPVHFYTAQQLRDVAGDFTPSDFVRSVTGVDNVCERAAALEKPCIFAIGNAPTALFSLEALMEAGKLHPALIIGVPVGFVNVVESKERIIEAAAAPYIVARGRKGGSNVAAAICNAMLYQIRR